MSEKIKQDRGLPGAIICDIDGTIALRGDRGPFEWKRVGEDVPNDPVISVIESFRDTIRIILFSGRDEVCRPETKMWLAKHMIPYDELHMRPKDNNEKDSIIKQRLFDEHVRGKYFVEFVLDDRNQVVDMWRANGLTCFQVAPGDF